MKAAGLIAIALAGMHGVAGATTLPPLNDDSPTHQASPRASMPPPAATQNERDYFEASRIATNEARAAPAALFALEPRRTGSRY